MRARPTVRIAALVIASAMAFTAAACGSDSNESSGKVIAQLPKDTLTGSYLGLTPHRENVKSELNDHDANAYITAVGLFSLREGDRLQATIQVSRLSDDARPKSKDFQQQVANQIGGTKVQAFVMGGRDVYRSSQRKQSLTSWFEGRYFLILAVRDSYDTPRSLLRELLTKIELS